MEQNIVKNDTPATTEIRRLEIRQEVLRGRVLAGGSGGRWGFERALGELGRVSGTLRELSENHKTGGGNSMEEEGRVINVALKTLEQEEAQRSKILLRNIEQVKRQLEVDEKEERKIQELEAGIELLNQEILAATAAGKWSLVERKQVEQARLENILQDMKASRDQSTPVLERKLADLENRLNSIPGEVLADTFVEIMGLCHDQLERTLDFFDDAWEALERFGAGSAQQRMLKIKKESDTRELYDRLMRWTIC